jgi:DHA1 family inner membrane transport protein
MSDLNASRPLRALMLSYFAMGTSALAAIGAITAIAEGLGLGTGTVAGLVSAYAIVFAVTAPALQVIGAKLPRRTLLLAGLVLSAVGSLGSALATSYWALFIARVLVALGGAAIGPVASALGATLVPREQQGRALATVFSGMTLASVISTPAAEWMAAHVGWRAMFMTVAALNAIAAVAVRLAVKDARAGQALSVKALLAELRRPSIASGVAVMLFYMAGMFATFTMVVPILQARFGMSHSQVSTALLVFGIAGVAGNFLAKRLADRWSADHLIAASLVTLIAVFAGVQLAPAAGWIALALMVAWAVSNDVFMPSQQRRLAEMAPQARGLVLALNSSALYAGMSVGSLASGVVSARVGLSYLPLVSAAMLLAGAAILVLSRRLTRKPVGGAAACTCPREGSVSA